MFYIQLMVLAFIQNVSFTMTSGARNRDRLVYHAVCAACSSGLWFVTMHYLVATELNWIMAVPYLIGTVTGSLFGAKVSMKIEKLIGAKT